MDPCDQGKAQSFYCYVFKLRVLERYRGWLREVQRDRRSSSVGTNSRVKGFYYILKEINIGFRDNFCFGGFFSSNSI